MIANLLISFLTQKKKKLSVLHSFLWVRKSVLDGLKDWDDIWIVCKNCLEINNFFLVKHIDEWNILSFKKKYYSEKEKIKN